MANKFKIGDLEVLVVSDGKAVVPGTMYFRASTPERWNEHKRWLNHDGNLEFEFGCFLVRSGDKLVLIDTGTGPVEVGTFKGGALIGELAAAKVLRSPGVSTAQIDAEKVLEDNHPPTF